MSREIKAGSAYIEITAKAEALKATMRNIEGDVKKTAKNFEDYFRNLKLDIDNRLMVTKFNDLKGLAHALQVQLNQKMKLNADVASIEKTRIALDSVNSAMGRMKGTTSGYNAVGTDFVRIMQDAPYFLQSVQMGVMSTANNFQQFAMSMTAAMNRGIGFKAAMASMVTGMNGWMLAIQLGIAGILGFAMSQRGAKEDIKGTTEEIDKQTEAMKRMSQIALADAIFNTEKEVELLRKKSVIEKAAFEENQKRRAASSGLGATTAVFKFSGQEELDKQSKILMAYQAQSLALGGIEKVKLRIAELEELQAKVLGDVNDKNAQAQRRFYQDQIDALKKANDLMTFKETKAGKSVMDRFVEQQKELTEINKLLENKNISEAQRNYLLEKQKDLLAEIYKYDHPNTAVDATIKGLPYKAGKQAVSILGDSASGDGSPFQRMLRNVGEELDQADRKGEQFSRAMSNGFGNAIMGAESFLDVLKNVAAQLAGMVLQAGIFAGIMSIVNPSNPLGFGGFFTKMLGISSSTVGGGTLTAPTTYPAVATATMSQSSTGGGSGIDILRAIEQMQGNSSNQPITIVSKTYLDGKQIAESVTREQNRFAKNNIKVANG